MGRALPTSDEGVVLTWAAKIMRGGVFYRDIDAYQFPGASYLLAGWMALFGESVNAARWLAALVYTALTLTLYRISLRLTGQTRAALFGLGLLAFKFLAWPGFSAYFYGDVALLFAAAAIALLLDHFDRAAQSRLLAAGVCAGLALAAKQTVGIYLGGATLALLALPGPLLGSAPKTPRARFAEIGTFGLGAALVLAPMLGYFASQGVLGGLVTSGVLQPFLAYLPTSSISFLEPLAWWRFGAFEGMKGFPFSVGPFWSMLMNEQLPLRSWYPAYWFAGELFTRALYTSLPVAFGIAGWRWLRAARRREVTPAERRVFAFALLAFAVVASAFPRADFFHVISVYPVVFLLLFALPATRGGTRQNPDERRAPWLAATAVALLLVVTGALTLRNHAGMTYRLGLDRADLYVRPSQSWIEPLVDALDAALAPGERFFVYGHEAYYYFLARRYYPWPFAQLYPGQAGEDGGQELVDLLLRDPPKVVIRGVARWPGVPSLPSYAPKLEDWLQVKYRLADRFFENHPPPRGEAPPWWVLTVWLPHAR